MYRVFSHDIMKARLVPQNNETVAMLVSQTSPVGVELFSYANAFFCSNKFAFRCRPRENIRMNLGWPTSVTIQLFQFDSWQFQFFHFNFNLLTAISIYSQQFQFTLGNFNLLTAISIYSWQHSHDFSLRFCFAYHLPPTAADWDELRPV